jgi:hypothetical protein
MAASAEFTLIAALRLSDWLWCTGAMNQDQDQYSYILVSLPNSTGGPAILARLVNAKKTPLLCLHQVYKVLCQGKPENTFRQNVKRLAKPVIKQATSVQILQLRQMGAVGACASNCQLASVHTIVRLLQQMGISKVVVESLKQQVPFTASPAAAASTAGTAGPFQPTITTGLPTNLPHCTITGKALKAKYGLAATQPRLYHATPLSHQVRELKAWCQEAVQTDRASAMLGQLSWENMEGLISQFLGYIHRFHEVQLPTLDHFKDGNLVMHYISFCKARNLVASSVSLYLTEMATIVQWWGAKQGNTVQLQELMQWLDRLRKQVCRVLPHPKKDPVDLIKQGKAASPEVLVAHMEAKRLHVLELLRTKGRCYETAKATHDWLLCACLFGWVPPLRSSCLRSLLMPHSAGCLEKGCKDKQPPCSGNHLAYSPDHAWLEMHLPHHKNCGRWKGQAISFRVPADMGSLFKKHIRWGHAMLVEPWGEDTSQVFVTSKGTQLTQPHLQSILDYMLRELQVKIPAHWLRHIFVEERMSTSRVQGPEDLGAAMVMGHCCRQWVGDSYDRWFSKREAQRAVDSMHLWRQGVMDKLSKPAAQGNRA